MKIRAGHYPSQLIKAVYVNGEPVDKWTWVDDKTREVCRLKLNEHGYPTAIAGCYLTETLTGRVLIVWTGKPDMERCTDG